MQRQSALKAGTLQTSNNMGESNAVLPNTSKLSGSKSNVIYSQHSFDPAKTVFKPLVTVENRDYLARAEEQYLKQQEEIRQLAVGSLGDQPTNTGALDYMRIRNKYAPLLVVDKDGVHTQATQPGIESVYHMYGYSKEWKDNRFALLISDEEPEPKPINKTSKTMQILLEDQAKHQQLPVFQSNLSFNQVAAVPGVSAIYDLSESHLEAKEAKQNLGSAEMKIDSELMKAIEKQKELAFKQKRVVVRQVNDGLDNLRDLDLEDDAELGDSLFQVDPNYRAAYDPSSHFLGLTLPELVATAARKQAIIAKNRTDASGLQRSIPEIMLSKLGDSPHQRNRMDMDKLRLDTEDSRGVSDYYKKKTFPTHRRPSRGGYSMGTEGIDDDVVFDNEIGENYYQSGSFADKTAQSGDFIEDLANSRAMSMSRKGSAKQLRSRSRVDEESEGFGFIKDETVKQPRFAATEESAASDSDPFGVAQKPTKLPSAIKQKNLDSDKEVPASSKMKKQVSKDDIGELSSSGFGNSPSRFDLKQNAASREKKPPPILAQFANMGAAMSSAQALYQIGKGAEDLLPFSLDPAIYSPIKLKDPKSALNASRIAKPQVSRATVASASKQSAAAALFTDMQKAATALEAQVSQLRSAPTPLTSRQQQKIRAAQTQQLFVFVFMFEWRNFR